MEEWRRRGDGEGEGAAHAGGVHVVDGLRDGHHRLELLRARHPMHVREA